MDQLAHYLSVIPPDVWTTVLAGTGVSAAVMPIKKLLGENPKVNLFVTILLSFLTAFIPWLIQTGTNNPQLLGPATVQTVFWATLAYRYVIQPFSNFWSDYKQFKQDKKTSTTAAAVAAVTAPADTVAVEQNKISSEFSF